MARMPPAAICSVPSDGSRLAVPGRERGPEDLLGLLGHEEDRAASRRPPRPSWRRSSRPSAATQIGMRGRTGWLMSLSALPSPVPSPGGQRDVVRRAVVGERRLAGPHVAADLDDLAGAGERAVVGHAVEALDHLRARGAEPEDGSGRPRGRRRRRPSWRSASACGCRWAGWPSRSRPARSWRPGSP